MRLSKNEASMPVPYPLQNDSVAGHDLANVLETNYGHNGAAKTQRPSVRAVADLLDLVANQRQDLLTPLLTALNDSKPTQEHAEQLMDLVTDCGLAESQEDPCMTAMSIAKDLERLATTTSPWSHPAQVVKNPNAQALFSLCSARLERETGPARERLLKIQPRLERTARLAQKAATRRSQNQNATRPSKLVDQWL